MRKTCFSLMLLASFASRITTAASLPSGMNESEVKKTVKVIGTSGATRLLRSAEPYLLFPGFKIGFEALFISSKDVESLGNADGSLPPALFVPRLYLAKGLVYNIDLIISLLPRGVVNSLATYGAILKWTFLSERENIPGSIAAYGGYTKLSDLGSYDGEDWEFGLVASRDLVRIKPYFGLGMLFASGRVNNAVFSERGKHTALHLFAGLEWELPANVTIQVDLMNLDLHGSLLVSKKF